MSEPVYEVTSRQFTRHTRRCFSRDKSGQRKGASLVEVMVAITVLSIAVFGGSAYRYYATLDAKSADRQIAAARVALMLCESWKGQQGDQSYDPISHLSSDLTISKGSGPTSPDGFTLLGSYEVELNGVTCYVTLSWADIADGFRALNVVVGWAQRDLGEASFGDVDKLFRLTTYTLY